MKALLHISPLELMENSSMILPSEHQRSTELIYIKIVFNLKLPLIGQASDWVFRLGSRDKLCSK